MIDLDEAIILNESQRMDRPGDVTIFRARAAAGAYVEAFDVERGEYHALSGSGRLQQFAVVAGHVTLSDSEDRADHSHVVRKLLLHVVGHMRKTPPTPEQATIAELIELVGFQNE